MIRGIGPVYAKKLARAFGEKVFDVIEAEPDRLRAVDGIGAVRAGRITAAWSEQKAELHFSALVRPCNFGALGNSRQDCEETR